MMEDYQYSDDPDNLDLSRANVDDDDEEKEISPSTKEAATAAKAGIERFYKNLFKSIGERELRRVRYEQKMDQLGLSEEEREGRRKKLDQIETQFLRARRIRLTKDTFQTIKVIGRGSFGEVRLVRMRGTKKLYAMKKLKKSKMIERNQVAHVQNERDALAYLNDFYKQNLWVVRLYYSFQDAIYLYLVMEYAPGGDLMTTLMKYEVFTEEEARFYAAEIVLAVESIHKFDYIHRDIKPDNILLDKNGHIKLSDFGLCTGLTTDDRVSKFQNKYQQYLQQESESSSEHKPLSNSGNNNNTNTVDKKDKDWYSSINSDRFNSWKQKRRVLAYSEVGTPDYMAPEVLNPDGTGYGKEADWWSVGVILFEMMAGFPVFFSESGGGSDSTIRKIINWKQTLDEVFNDVDLSPEAQDLIRRLLTDRKERLGTGGADEIKRHPFFKDIDWDDIRAQQAPIVPRIEHPLDTSNFPVDDPDRFSDSEEEPEEDNEVKEEAESRREIDSKYPIFRGRRLRQTDIPFIGFTYKNLAAVPSLINRPPTPPHMRK